jgi:phage terminase small subunit
MAMNEQKEQFAMAVVRGLSKRDAAVAAGYSEKTASAAGSRLYKDADVVAYIAQLRAEAQAIAAVAGGAVSKNENAPIFGGAGDDVAESVDFTEKTAKERAVVDGNTVTLDGVAYDLTDPKDRLTLHMIGVIAMSKSQQDSAKALLPFAHGKIGDQGKKGAQEQAARDAVGGRFSPMAPPQPVQGSLLQ